MKGHSYWWVVIIVSVVSSRLKPKTYNFVYYESIKRELKTNLYMSVGAKQDEKLKNLYAPHALCCTTKRKVDKQAKTQSRNPR